MQRFPKKSGILGFQNPGDPAVAAQAAPKGAQGFREPPLGCDPTGFRLWIRFRTSLEHPRARFMAGPG